MPLSDFPVIDWPLLEAVQFEEVSVEGDVADEVEGLAGVTTSRRWKDRVAAALETSSSSRNGMGIVSLKK